MANNRSLLGDETANMRVLELAMDAAGRSLNFSTDESIHLELPMAGRSRTMKVNRRLQVEPVLAGDHSELADIAYQEHVPLMNGDSSADLHRFRTGDRVRVVEGPFAGVEGTVKQCSPAGRTEIALHLLQAGVSLEIDERWLEAAR